MKVPVTLVFRLLEGARFVCVLIKLDNGYTQKAIGGSDLMEGQTVSVETLRRLKCAGIQIWTYSEREVPEPFY